jgi:beta-galactosidase
MGEAENYQDRCSGTKLKIFENNVKDNYTFYTIPQECGNRTGVRWVECRQSAGGFKIEAIDKLLSCNFLPYTAFELEQAQHHYELPPIHYTVVTIAAKQMGIGGDDSWGAEVHPEYCLPADGELSFAFVIKVV